MFFQQGLKITNPQLAFAAKYSHYFEVLFQIVRKGLETGEDRDEETNMVLFFNSNPIQWAAKVEIDRNVS